MFQAHSVNSDALEIKRIMAESIQRASEVYGLTKKSLSIDLGLDPETGMSILSHYLSPRCGFTIPAHLVRRFCELTHDWTLARALQKRKVA